MGLFVHAHTVYRNPRLAALSPEELQSLDALTKKLALPALEAPQDSPHTQPDSAPAIAIDVECEDTSGQLQVNDYKVLISTVPHVVNKKRGFRWD